MPRLSPASKAARRMQIAQAAITCMVRDGIARTSMADIIKESGLSAGSIYSHFESKEELLRFTTTTLLEAQSATARTAGASLTPRTLVVQMLERIDSNVPHAALLQVWAEVARDPDLRGVAQEVLAGIKEIHTAALMPWARTHRSEDDAARRLAAGSADAVIAAAHGYVVRTSVDDSVDPAHLLTVVSASLDTLPAYLPV